MFRNVLTLALCQALMMSGNTLMITSAALVGSSLADNKALATLPLALQFLATMLMTIPAAMIMRRIGRQRGFAIGHLLALAGAGCAVWALFEAQFWLFCVAAVLVGAYNGFGIYYRFAAAESVDESRRATAISYVMAGGVIAAFIGPNMANWTRDTVSAIPFAGGFMGLAGLYLLSLGILAMSRLPGPGEESASGQSRPLGVIVRQPAFLAALVAGMLGYGVMSLIMTATPLAMKGHAHDFADTAFVIQWHVLAMFAPAFFTGHLIRRFGVMPVMVVGAIAELACALINLHGDSLWHYWSALFLLGLGWSFLFVGATTLLTTTYHPAERAKVQALNDFLIFTTVTFASLSAGVLQHHLGWQAVNLGMLPAILIILATLAWVGFRRNDALTTDSPG